MQQVAAREVAVVVPAHIRAAGASLPKSYEAARVALANCARLDECQDWADKAAALASYAKQANDDELMKTAVRIRDRAIRRAGELLKQIEPNKGGRPAETRDATAPSFKSASRKDAGEAAGMSERQVKTAIRVANVPAAEFERQVESEKPPTVTKLAEQGKRSAPRPVVDLKGRDPEEFNRAMHYVAGWENAARDLGALDHGGALVLLTEPERARLRKAISAIDAITDRTMARV